MGTTKAKAKDWKKVIKATFPNNRKRAVYVKHTDKVTFYDLNWSGGTRSKYRACLVDGRPLNGGGGLNAPAPWVNPYEGLTVDLPIGAVIVCESVFCGEFTPLTIYINQGLVE